MRAQTAYEAPGSRSPLGRSFAKWIAPGRVGLAPRTRGQDDDVVGLWRALPDKLAVGAQVLVCLL